MIVDGNISEEGVLEEAEFYNIVSVVKILDDRIKARSSGKVIVHAYVHARSHCTYLLIVPKICLSQDRDVRERVIKHIQSQYMCVCVFVCVCYMY